MKLNFESAKIEAEKLGIKLLSDFSEEVLSSTENLIKEKGDQILIRILNFTYNRKFYEQYFGHSEKLGNVFVTTISEILPNNETGGVINYIVEENSTNTNIYNPEQYILFDELSANILPKRKSAVLAEITAKIAGYNFVAYELFEMIEKFQKGRDDVFWYPNGQIAFYTNDRYEISVESVGECQFEYNGDRYRYKYGIDDDELIEIEEMGIKRDADLSKLDFSASPWFEVIIYDTKNKEYISEGYETVIDYADDVFDLDYYLSIIREYEQEYDGQ